MESSASTGSGYLLVIERGRSRYPQRPIDGERFLIGAGSNCQLQLGGQMPMLHSIIIQEDDHLWIDAVVADPPLIVNGQRIRESELRRGDVIQIADFTFSIDRRAVEQAVPVAESAAPATALELLKLLADELESLQQLAKGRNHGAAALLDAAVRSGSATADDSGDLSLSQLELMAQLEAELDQQQRAPLRKSA
ncbi:FHA domain-containing protein [Planctomicrobium piriforme]|uniref:FHA domain-containing protein n=1 Tax=Planctomicrobium piriforme TaxID=1576369 RepID=A0A1I3E562_9PLAN|nr:FHA domain-containing protein [Planctomicrobium piriforme]SFH94120.1 hypothetical protein SAMN05421753_10485 [Planctomicrobium piriforme]